jgi:uncharacterized NAD-dependent epimerase/dehydratase family protein
MYSHTRHRLQQVLLLVLALGSLVVAGPPRAQPLSDDPVRAQDPVHAMARAAQPLSDLRPLERMIGTAKVVGIGEATHNWVLQHARAIAQTGTEFSYDLFDPAQIGEAMRYRDRIMAENTV